MEPITASNRRIVMQEWLAEAFTMWGIAAIVIVATAAAVHLTADHGHHVLGDSAGPATVAPPAAPTMSARRLVRRLKPMENSLPFVGRPASAWTVGVHRRIASRHEPSAPATLPHRAVVRTTRASPQNG
jgi:hypothetical protein